MKAEYKEWAEIAAKDMMATFEAPTKVVIDAKTGKIGEATTKRNRSNVTTCAVCFEDGRIVHITNTACHAGLGGVGYNYKTKAVAITNAVMNNGWLKKQDVLNWLDWLANRSPFAKIFITKDAQDMLDNGMIVSTDHPANVVVGALILNRGCSEYKPICHTFNRLSELGVNENLACVMGHTFSCSEGGKEFYPNNGHYAGHVLFDAVGVMNRNNIEAFVKGEFYNLLDNYSTYKGYSKINSLNHCPNPGKEIRGDIIKHINDWIKNDGKPKKVDNVVKNPFAKNIGVNKAGGDYKTLPYDKAIKGLADYLKQEFKEYH